MIGLVRCRVLKEVPDPRQVATIATTSVPLFGPKRKGGRYLARKQQYKPVRKTTAQRIEELKKELAETEPPDTTIHGPAPKVKEGPPRSMSDAIWLQEYNKLWNDVTATDLSLSVRDKIKVDRQQILSGGLTKSESTRIIQEALDTAKGIDRHEKAKLKKSLRCSDEYFQSVISMVSKETSMLVYDALQKDHTESWGA
jgi:hypothetical protein